MESVSQCFSNILICHRIKNPVHIIRDSNVDSRDTLSTTWLFKADHAVLDNAYRPIILYIPAACRDSSLSPKQKSTLPVAHSCLYQICVIPFSYISCSLIINEFTEVSCRSSWYRTVPIRFRLILFPPPSHYCLSVRSGIKK